MTTLKIQIIGLKDTIMKLTKEFPARLKTKIAEALLESAGEIQTTAIQLAPIKTGTLRRSIRVLFSSQQLYAAVIGGGSEVPYAKYQEFGTYGNRIESDNISSIRAALKSGFSIKRGKGIVPKLFLHRAGILSKPRIEEIFKRKVTEMINDLRRTKEVDKFFDRQN